MQIKLKSNRRFIFNILLPGVIIITIGVLFIAIAMLVEYDSEFLLPLIILAGFDLVYILVLLITKFRPHPIYIFSSSEILVNRKKQQYKIETSNIELMHYYPFRWYYIITIFAGALNEGGAMKIHVKEKNGKKHQLGYIGEKDARKLKEIYPDLLTIHYSERGRINNK